MSPCLDTSSLSSTGDGIENMSAGISSMVMTDERSTEERGQPPSPRIRTFSLGSGSFAADGGVHFIASPNAKEIRSRCNSTDTLSHNLTATTSVASSLSSLSGFANNHGLSTPGSSPSASLLSRKMDIGENGDDDISKRSNETMSDTLTTKVQNTNTPSKHEKHRSTSFGSPKRIIEKVSEKLEKVVTRRKVHFVRSGSSYMRSADLGMSDCNPHHSMHNDQDEIVSNYHHPSPNPPPGIDLDSKEQWVALDDGAGSHSPIAPLVIQALAESGYKSATEPNMWVPEKKTDKLLKSSLSAWKSSCVWTQKADGKGATVPPKGSEEEKEILLWQGCFEHTYYGSDLPAVRAMGVIGMPAKSLFDLLVDSSRVKEYNNLSLGREDVLVLQDNMEEDGPFGKSITKIMQSQNKPPIVRKPVQLTTLMHAKELSTGNGYMVVSRAVTKPDDLGSISNGDVLTSEILLGVTLIVKVDEEDEDRCLMINVNHVRPTMVPLMVAKRIGLAAAQSFIHDIRSLC